MENRSACEVLRPDALPLRLLGSVWLPFACGYFLSFALRNVNAVLAPELAREFSLGAADLGLLTSAYLVAFALAQLPMGLLLDRYGPRRVDAALMLVAAGGCAIHVVGTSFGAVALGRALVGVGVAVCLMSAVKALSQWLPAARLPLAMSLLLTFGSLGGLLAAGPVGWALQFVAWRTVFAVAAALLVCAAAFLFLVTPDRSEASAGDSWLKLAAGTVTVFSSPVFWRLGLLFAVSGGTFTAMQSLWIGTWLRDVAGLDRAASVGMITWFALASTVGYVVTGMLCDWLIRRGITPFALYKVHGAILIGIVALIAFADPQLGLPLWFAYFALGMGGPLVLTVFARAFPPHLSGRVNTAVNVLMFAMAFAIQWGTGLLLDQWPAEDGRYAALGYTIAFGTLLAAMCALYVFMLMGEK